MQNKFIELTMLKRDNSILINVGTITNVIPTDYGCFVTLNFDRNGLSIGVDVTESYDKVKSMIM